MVWWYERESAGDDGAAAGVVVGMRESGNAPTKGPHEKPTKNDSASWRRMDRGVVRRIEGAGELPSSDG